MECREREAHNRKSPRSLLILYGRGIRLKRRDRHSRRGHCEPRGAFRVPTWNKAAQKQNSQAPYAWQLLFGKTYKPTVGNEPLARAVRIAGAHAETGTRGNTLPAFGAQAGVPVPRPVKETEMK